MSSGGAGPLVPTFHGFVHNTMDGLVLFEACLSGKLHHVPRRPHDRERASLIKSGSIFIYEENASGIKRWTDGVAWSPSRILGNFLIYRELEKPFPPGEKKRAIKRKRTTAPGEPYPRRGSDETDGAEIITPLTPPSPGPSHEAKPETLGTDQEKELERSLIGSLVDSYGFRPDGLVKKTMSVSVNGISHHMVSYYKVEDVKNNVLPRPLSDPRLQNISVRPELYLKQNFRAPVEETEHYAIDGHMHAHPQAMYSSMVGGYGVRPGQYAGHPYTGIYGMQASTGAGVYGAMTGTSWPTQQTSMGALSYGNRAYGSQAYPDYYQPSMTSAATPAVKSEHQQAATPAPAYNTQYASNYASMPRHDAQSTPMMHSTYHPPTQSATSSFGSMSAPNGRPSYSNTMSSPATHNQPQQMYSTGGPQQYAVRSPVQPYAMHSAPTSAIPQPSHSDLKSPLSATHPGPPSTDPHMSYRDPSYRVQTPQSARGTPHMSGLGINGGPGYANQAQNGHEYHHYNSTTQPYRGSMAASGPVQYAQ
ncbi:Global transcription regulator sge1 [Friedmanniomyces endolithicus]|uniref:Global transcription regulator sge1 n=1 Tax=Friedmanniomyces endolithicus TaxID=329885 RepID=A0AAN6JLQ4_9PEZI|nr:Global transcription regulator sge1 [Friedmanniomyces endolithicus]KAK0298918.1 Global transcription regulator sge1 [Friedmanniomyces endolithicus]KAK0328910.1 Global transcription regulator sge1 [Friedmanniomyces endolithicus]KAK1003863.1 Global transcription regulator sge1 [Friedmanniomyces endolithicus]